MSRFILLLTRIRFSLPATLLLLMGSLAQGQTNAGIPEQPAGPGYNPHDLFAPGFYSEGRPATRSANGAPSPAYWQNRADYTLAAKLDTMKNEIEGSDIIRYVNNSPDSLHSLWLYLEQHTYRT